MQYLFLVYDTNINQNDVLSKLKINVAQNFGKIPTNFLFTSKVKILYERIRRLEIQGIRT